MLIKLCSFNGQCASNQFFKIFRFSSLMLVIASCFQACGDSGSDSESNKQQPPNVVVSAQVRSTTLASDTLLRAVLMVDGAEVTPTLQPLGNSNRYIAGLRLKPDVDHRFSFTLFASRPKQFIGEIIVAAVAEETHYVSSNDPGNNRIFLNIANYDDNDDGDLYTNWEELLLGYNPVKMETWRNPVILEKGLAGSNEGDAKYSIASLVDGGWLVAGYLSAAAGNADMALWKYTANGELDTSFAQAGVFTQDNAAGGSGNDFANAITVLPDGSWVVVGKSDSNTTALYDDMVVWKFTADGVLDSSFGNGGVFVFDNAAGGSANDAAFGVSVLPDGGWIVAGYSDNANANTDVALWKFTAAGVLDAAFADGGVFVYDNIIGGVANDYGYNVTTLPDGGWIVAGFSSGSYGFAMMLLKFTASGQLDSSFGQSGVFTYDNSTRFGEKDVALDVATLPDGGWVVTGYADYNRSYNSDMAVWKFTSNGLLDSSFGSNGVFTINGPTDYASSDIGRAISVFPDGGWIIAGTSTNVKNNDMALWKFLADGSLDPSFGNSGAFSHDNAAGGQGNDFAYDVTVLSDGTWAVVGASANDAGGSDIVIW